MGDPQFEAFIASVLSKPISYISSDGKKRNVYASTNSPGGISVASKHARNRLSALAQKLLNEDSNSLLSISHVSPAKQARAMRTRIARYSGKPGPVGSEEPWGASALDEGGNSPKGKSALNENDDDDDDPANNIILGGGRSNRHNVHLAHLIPKSGGRHSGPRVSPLRSNSDDIDISSSPSNKLKLVPLTLRRDPHANRPHPDISTEPVSAAVTEWAAPTRLYVWGSGSFGQLGCGLDDGKPSVLCSRRPMRLDLPSETGQGEFQSSGSKLTPIRVACGFTVTGVVDNQRRVWATGDGWLGRGIKERSHTPVLVQGIGSGGSQVIDLACGKGFMVCCTVEGAVFVWGENLGLASLKASTDAKKFRKDVTSIGSPIKVDKHATMSKTSPEKTTNNDEPTMGHPLGLPGGELHRVPLPKQIPSSCFQNHEAIVSVAAGEGHIVALSNDGNVYTWGAGTSGACGHGSGEHQWVPKILKLRPRRVRPAGTFRISGSSGRAAGDGEHGGWGSDNEGPEKGDGAASVSGASAVGRGVSTSPSNSKRLASIAESSSSSSSSLPAHLQQSKAFAISAGAHHTAVLAIDGTAFVCGFAEKGRLGLGIDVPTAVTKPTQILGLPPLVSIACGEAHTLFLSVEGRIYAAGDNSFGQCGINTRIFKPSPFVRTDLHSGSQTEVTVETRVLVPRQVFTSIFGPVLATRIAAGARHSAAVDISGRMWTWGFNTDGTLGDGTDVTAPEPVKVARFAEVCVLQASLSSSHTATIISRNRIVTKSNAPTGAGGSNSNRSDDGNTAAAISAVISQLEDDSGLVSALEVPLPLLLKRLRRHSIHIRMKAAAFGTNFKRKKARERRRRAIRMAMTRNFASALDSGSSLTDSVSSTNISQVHANQPKNRYAVTEKLDMNSWESDPDLSEYGKNAACFVIQTSFAHYIQRKKAIQAKRMKEYKEQQAMFTRKAEMKRRQK